MGGCGTWSLLRADEGPPRVVLQPAPEERARPEEPVEVWLHNDDYTPTGYVVDVLREVFGLGWWRANWVMSRAHVGGRCLVGRYPRKEAEAKLAAAHGRARADGWPLRFSVEEA